MPANDLGLRYSWPVFRGHAPLLQHYKVTPRDGICNPFRNVLAKVISRLNLNAFLLTPGSPAVCAYGIIRDADRNREDAFKSVVNLLKKRGEPCPDKIGIYVENEIRKVGVFIMPGNQDEGMLEYLCLQTIADYPVMACTEQYFSCLKTKLAHSKPNQPEEQDNRYYYPKNPSKAKALAFLAGNHETFNSVGVAALNGCWNFDHPILTDLKKFIHSL